MYRIYEDYMGPFSNGVVKSFHNAVQGFQNSLWNQWSVIFEFKLYLFHENHFLLFRSLAQQSAMFGFSERGSWNE